MAPSFDHLPDPEDDEYDEDELDFSDLREKFEVQLEQGLDTFVVIDGLPEVTEETKSKLIKFLLRKLNAVGRTREDSVFMPIGEDGKSHRFVRTSPIYASKLTQQVRVCRVFISSRGCCSMQGPRSSSLGQKAYTSSQQAY